MDPASTIGVAAAAAQFAGLALSVSTTLRHYWRAVSNAPKQSRELKQELLLVSDVLEDLKSVRPMETRSSGVLPANVTLKDSTSEIGLSCCFWSRQDSKEGSDY